MDSDSGRAWNDPHPFGITLKPKKQEYLEGVALSLPPEIIAPTRSSHPQDDDMTTTRPSEEGCAGCLLGMLRAARRNTADGLRNGLRMTLLLLLPRRYAAFFDESYHVGVTSGSGIITGATTPYVYVSSPMSKFSTCDDCRVTADAQHPHHHHPLPQIPPLPVSHRAHQGSLRPTPACSFTGGAPDGAFSSYFSFWYSTSVGPSSGGGSSGTSTPVREPSQSHDEAGVATPGSGDGATAAGDCSVRILGSRSSSFSGSIRMAVTSSSGSSSGCCSPESSSSDGIQSSPAASICYTPCSSMSPSEGLSPAPSDDAATSPITTSTTTTWGTTSCKSGVAEDYPTASAVTLTTAPLKYTTVGRDSDFVAADTAATDAESPAVAVRSGGLGGLFSRGGSFEALAYSYRSRIAEVNAAPQDMAEAVVEERVPLLSAQPLVTRS